MKVFNDTEYDVLPIEKFKLFSDLENWSLPSPDSEEGKYLIKKAEEVFESPIKMLCASDYRKFNITGNRTEFEGVYFKRRVDLRKLIIGEAVQSEDRYTDKIIDLVWAILEETTWVIPAHNLLCGSGNNGEKASLPLTYTGEHSFIDLFSGETAAILALAYHFMKEKFDNAVPKIINDAIKYAIKERITKPFLEKEDMWWMGYDGRKPNNWNPWIVSSILTAVAITEEDTETRKKVLKKAMICLDRFVDGYKPDGGCDEGPSYWSAAGSCLFDCLELMYDLTGGAADYFDNPLVYNIFDYIRKVHMHENYFTTFADGPAKCYVGGLTFGMRMAERTNNDALYSFASSLTGNVPSVDGTHIHGRTIKDLGYKRKAAEKFVRRGFDLLPDLQVAVVRKGKMTVGAKGGHNKESHNHNDVGNVIVFANGKPILIDIGAPTYTKDTFSDKRYTIFPINSTWHNLPIINGYGEKEGIEFVADAFVADEDMIRIQYESAYEKEAGVKSAVREIKVSDDEVLISEKVQYSGEAVFNYYLCEKPAADKNTFLFSNGAKIIFPENLKVSLEDVPLTDAAVIKNWGTETLYRISVKCSENAEFEMKIKA